MTSETFEQVLTAAQADGAFTPAWKKFVNTKFFVPVVRAVGADPGHFRLDVAHEGGQSIQISEVREWLGQREAGALATLSGADVVRMLGADAAILIALSDRAFRIARERVEWLKKGIEASQAKAAAKALEAAGGAPAVHTAVHAAVQAAPVSMVKAAPSLAPVAPAAPAPVARRQGGVLDVAALKPRSVGLPKVGLDFFVPGAWREIQNNKGLQFVDEDSGTVVKASGFHRPDMTLAKWQSMSMALVEHDMRYLTQDGAPYAIDGDDWRDRVKGMATEFTGTFPGDDTPSRYLVACVRVDGTVASITIRAPAEQFEQNRALYKWLLGRIDLNETAAIDQQRAAGGAASGRWQHDDAVEKPGIFGISLTGRITRLQALAYSFPIWLPFIGVAVLAAMVAPTNWTLAIVMGVSALVVALWLSLRLLVLRLHDANISGKWILYFIGVAIVAAVIRNSTLLTLVLFGGWLLSMVFYGVVPGTPDDNDYGPQPDENSTLVKIGAGLFILLNLMSIMGQGKMMSTPGYQNPLRFGGAGSANQSEMVTFEPDDRSFMVDMPGTPEVVPMPPAAQSMGARIQIYQLTTDDGAYQAQTIDFGGATIDHTGVMDSVQAGVVGSGGMLRSSSTIILNGFKGREVRAKLPNGLLRSARYVIVGAKIRMVMIMTNDDPSGLARTEAFLSSFKLA